MSYISHQDYKNLMSKFQAEADKSILKEDLDPVGQEDSDIDNDGDTDKTDKYLLKRRQAIGKAIGKGRMMKEDEVEEYGYADNYPGSWGYREGKEEDDDLDTLVDLISRYTKDDPEKLAGLDPQAWPDDVATNMARDKDYQAYKQKHHKEGLNPAPMQATGPTIDMTEEKLNVQSPEEVAKFVASKHPELALKLGAEKESEALKHAYQEILKASGEVVARNLINGLSNEDWPSDYLQALKGMLGKKEEGLNPAPMQATGQSIEEDHMDRPFKLPKRTDTSKLDYDPDASRFEPDYMKTPGEDDDDDDIISATDDFDDLDLGDEIPMHFKKAVAKDKARYPFLRENTTANPPYGFDVLSPDERKQLKEYIESIKTIKKEIARLAAKAGKKVKTEGGDMTGLTMTPSVTSERVSHEDIEKIESRIPEKLYVASEKVIKHLKKAGLTPGEIKMYLNHEIEELVKREKEAQYDIAETVSIVPENADSRPEETDKKKVIAANLKKGDIMAGTGEKVLNVWPGARTMSGRLDMSKVTVELEGTKKDGTKTTRVGLWGKNTLVGIHRSTEG